MQSVEVLEFDKVIEYRFLERLSHLKWNTSDSDFYQIKTYQRKNPMGESK